jgi:hypothetical protein
VLLVEENREFPRRKRVNWNSPALRSRPARANFDAGLLEAHLRHIQCRQAAVVATVGTDSLRALMAAIGPNPDVGGTEMIAWKLTLTL